MTNLRKVATTLTSVAVISATAVGPAIAGNRNDDGEDRGTPLSLTQAILWFVVAPIVISALISALVMAPGWVRKARASSVNGFLDDPTRADRISISSHDHAQIGQ